MTNSTILLHSCSLLCQPMSFANAWQAQQLCVIEFTKLLKRSHGSSKCGDTVLVGLAVLG